MSEKGRPPSSNKYFLDMVVWKRCPRCDKRYDHPDKIAEAFGLNKRQKSGYQVYCKQCRKNK